MEWQWKGDRDVSVCSATSLTGTALRLVIRRIDEAFKVTVWACRDVRWVVHRVHLAESMGEAKLLAQYGRRRDKPNGGAIHHQYRPRSEYQ
jgi:hypothetical protein